MKYLLILFIILTGGFDIWNSARCFKSGKYFFGGISCMLAIWMITLLIEVVWKV